LELIISQLKQQKKRELAEKKQFQPASSTPAPAAVVKAAAMFRIASLMVRTKESHKQNVKRVQSKKKSLYSIAEQDMAERLARKSRDQS